MIAAKNLATGVRQRQNITPTPLKIFSANSFLVASRVLFPLLSFFDEFTKNKLKENIFNCENMSGGEFMESLTV